MIELGNIKKIDWDVELCYTASRTGSEEAIDLLLESEIPFTEKQIRIPFFLKKRYGNADRIHVIRINRNRYDQALLLMRNLSPGVRRRVVFP